MPFEAINVVGLDTCMHGTISTGIIIIIITCAESAMMRPIAAVLDCIMAVNIPEIPMPKILWERAWPLQNIIL